MKIYNAGWRGSVESRHLLGSPPQKVTAFGPQKVADGGGTRAGGASFHLMPLPPPNETPGASDIA